MQRGQPLVSAVHAGGLTHDHLDAAGIAQGLQLCQRFGRGVEDIAPVQQLHAGGLPGGCCFHSAGHGGIVTAVHHQPLVFERGRGR